MRGAVLYGPRDVRFEEREVPKIVKPTDAVIRISSACVCGSRPRACAGLICGRIAASNQLLGQPRWGTSTAASWRK